jgi:hypothetical protein
VKNYFIPNQNNDYHPQILKRGEIVKIIAGILLLEAIFLVQVFFVVPRADFFASVLPGVLVNLANSDRQSNNLSSLVTNPLLERAAQLKANDMLSRGYFSHVTPDGKTPWYWLNLVGYKYSAAGENLAINFVDSKDINDAWMNSPSHRANILNNKFSEIGVAAAKGVYQGRETIFVVQFFGRPAQKSVTAAQTSPITPPASKNVVTPVQTPATDQIVTTPVKSASTETVHPSSAAGADQNPTEFPIASRGQSQTDNSLQSVSPAEEMFIINEDLSVAENLDAENLGAEADLVNQSRAQQQRGFVSSLKTVLTSPRVIINLIFIILGGIIFLVLILKLLGRTGIQYAHPVFNGLLILVILISLFYFNHHLLLARAQIF